MAVPPKCCTNGPGFHVISGLYSGLSGYPPSAFRTLYLPSHLNRQEELPVISPGGDLQISKGLEIEVVSDSCT
ncbi:hypothetical protein BJX61DRAFT_502345 [Aspergillus egyptiacus]|nr:hypothetical protein BJX61DRAFT_502345 [Aspergillus egyptiacus]